MGATAVLLPSGPALPGTSPREIDRVRSGQLRHGRRQASAEAFIYTDWVTAAGSTSSSARRSSKPASQLAARRGLRVGYNWASGKYEAAVFGRNITNQVRAVGGIDLNNLTGFNNDPRTVGAQFKMRF